MSLGRIYDYLIVESADPLTRGWPLIDSPLPITIVTVAYIYLVLYAGPRYMKDRPPFKLRTFILLYNLFQVLANAWVVKEHISAGWITKYSLNVNCFINTTDSTTPDGVRLITTCWWLFLLKLIDYVETCVFVLRKKQNQVSTLHVYHHVLVIFIGWYYIKYIVDPRATIATLINCFVHVIMYTYYFVAAWSAKAQQVVSSIKPYITKMQMIQFVWFLFLLLKTIPNPKCNILSQTRTLVFAYLAFFNMLFLLYLFYDFYKTTYAKAREQKNAKQKD